MKKILTMAAIVTVLVSGCSLNMNAGKSVISVNGHEITQAEFNKAVDKEINGSMFKAFGGADNFVKSDDNVMYLIFKEKVSRELIIKALLDDEIHKRGIKVTDEDIKNETKSIIDKVGSKEELSKLLKKRGITNDQFNADLKTQIKMKKLIDSLEKVSISDADTLKYYKAHPEMFKREEQVRASHILIDCNALTMITDIKKKNKKISPEELNKKVEEMQAERKAKAESILKEVLADPESFEKIAQKESDDKNSAEYGGELGYFPRKVMTPEFSEAAFSMKPNTINDKLVKTMYGYHIIKVTDRIEPGIVPYEKTKEDIKFYMETEAQMAVLKKFTDGLMKTAKIEYLDKSFDPTNIEKNAIKANEESKKKMNINGEAK